MAVAMRGFKQRVNGGRKLTLWDGRGSVFTRRRHHIGGDPAGADGVDQGAV